MYPVPKGPVKLKKKSESRLMWWISKLPGVPESFLTEFWTTIGHTIYVPAKHDSAKDWGTHAWKFRNVDSWMHESRHICQEERYGKLLYLTMYFGPVVWLLFAIPFVVLGYNLGWVPPLGVVMFALAIQLLTPLSVGLAYGRWILEREAYMVQIRSAKATGWDMDIVIDQITSSLWSDYFFTWPQPWSRKWFRDELKKGEAQPPPSSGN